MVVCKIGSTLAGLDKNGIPFLSSRARLDIHLLYATKMKNIIHSILPITLLLFAVNIASAGDVKLAPLGAPLLINVNNLDDFYEFQFSPDGRGIDKKHEGKVEKIVESERTRYVWSSKGFNEKYSAKITKRTSMVKKYRDAFSLYDYSIVEISEDGNYIAYTRNYDNKILYVASLQNNKTLFSIRPSKGENINDVEWTMDSIALMTERSRIGYWPWELLAAFAGHPIPHNTLYLESYSLQGDLIKADLVWKNITYGRGALVKTTN